MTNNKTDDIIYCPCTNPMTGKPCRKALGRRVAFGVVVNLPNILMATRPEDLGGVKLICPDCGDGYVWETYREVDVPLVRDLLKKADARGWKTIRFRSDRKYRAKRIQLAET